jgi:purine-nucleoside phosphorylase
MQPSTMPPKTMQPLAAQIDEAAAAVRQRWSGAPSVGIILGSGLGAVGERIELEAAIDYDAIPHFLRTSAVGHRGRLLCGKLAGATLVAMQGRFHLYEGHSADRIAFPIRLLKRLGVETLIVSNAAGGLNPTYAAGDVMAIDDHINLMDRNPLIGPNDDDLGPRFPDMSAPYDRALGDRALAIARAGDFACHRGTYIGMLGPNYETRAEIRMLRDWGDAVGMSTVPEVIAAVHCGLKVLGLSTITNVCSPDVRHVATHDEVVATANSACNNLLAIVSGVVAGATT